MKSSHIARILIALLVLAAVIAVVSSKRPRPAPSAEASAPTVDAALPRLLDLGSETCIPCKMMVPVLAELRTEYRGRLQVDFVNTTEDKAAVERYGIAVIPTQILFDPAGKELGRHTGFWPKEDILAQFAAYGIELGPGRAEDAGR